MRRVPIRSLSSAVRRRAPRSPGRGLAAFDDALAAAWADIDDLDSR